MGPCGWVEVQVVKRVTASVVGVLVGLAATWLIIVAAQRQPARLVTRGPQPTPADEHTQFGVVALMWSAGCEGEQIAEERGAPEVGMSPLTDTRSPSPCSRPVLGETSGQPSCPESAAWWSRVTGGLSLATIPPGRRRSSTPSPTQSLPCSERTTGSRPDLAAQSSRWRLRCAGCTSGSATQMAPPGSPTTPVSLCSGGCRADDSLILRPATASYPLGTPRRYPRSVSRPRHLHHCVPTRRMTLSGFLVAGGRDRPSAGGQRAE